ncbi:MAG TPA: hypothetical protein VIL07_03320 [Symbiobacteriaceae bacterium]
MMPTGSVALVLLLLLAGFGFLDGILARMRLTARQVLAVAAAMLLGSPFTLSLAPDLRLNVGTGLVSVAAAMGLMAGCGSGREILRTAASALVTATAVYLVGRWFPPGWPTELNFFYLDAQYLFGLMAALVACGTGRSHRGIFAAAVLGVMLADLAHFAAKRWGDGKAGIIHIGGGPFWATAVVAGLLAVLLAELVGERRQSVPHSPAQHPPGPLP